MFCPNCGFKNADDSAFCEQCGTKLNISEPVEAPVAETPAVETTVAEIPVEEAPVEEAPVVETPVAETPVVETPVEETPTPEVTVADYLKGEETPEDEAPAAGYATPDAEPVYEAPASGYAAPAEAPVYETPAAEYPQQEYQPAYGQEYQQQYVPAYQPAYQPQYQPAVKPPRSSHPTLNALKNVGASPLLLIAAIAVSANLFLGIIKLFAGNYSVFGTVYSYLYRLGISDFNEILNDISTATYGYMTLLSFLFLIPTLIYTIGVWITYISANSRGNNGMSTAGLTMIKVMQIISLIFTCILFAASEIVCIIASVAAAALDRTNDGSSLSGSSLTFFIVSASVVALLYIFVIIYIAKVISSINAVKRTVSTGNSVYRVSGFVGVMNFIIAGFSLFGVFYGGALSVFEGICDITALVCFALLLFKFNRAMRRATGNFNQTYNVYSNSQYPNGGYGRM
ncbi:MAG: zinc-ribbon domain-containing protein [Clostridia bacterium]|nr:zinc-ribbon domain-containing protein [Clostridia bacterium]